jgi:hypothetical protein
MNTPQHDSSGADGKTEGRMVREVATEVIRRNPHIWDTLKHRLREGHPVAVYGSDMHVEVVTAVAGHITKLDGPTGERVRQIRDVVLRVTGEIFNRALRVAARF